MNRRAFLGTATAAGLAGLAGCLGATEYRIERASVVDGDGPLGLSVDVADRSVTVDSPGALTFELRNESDGPVRVRNTGVWPLGVVQLAPSLDAGSGGLETARLWSDAYARSEHVDASGAAFGVDGEPLVRSLAPGERVRRRYEVRGEPVDGAQTYVVRGGFGSFEAGDDDAVAAPLLRYRADGEAAWSRFLPAVRVTLSELSLLP